MSAARRMADASMSCIQKRFLVIGRPFRKRAIGQMHTEFVHEPGRQMPVCRVFREGSRNRTLIFRKRALRKLHTDSYMTDCVHFIHLHGIPRLRARLHSDLIRARGVFPRCWQASVLHTAGLVSQAGVVRYANA